ncbi:MAG: hypothetical protein Q8942_02430 [Bacillota bacterium]|nr:hypothetical protein [Bacillota bacterium]
MRRFFLTTIFALLFLSIFPLRLFAADSCKISGYVKPDFANIVGVATILNSDIKVEISGTDYSAKTNNRGYFEITNVPKNESGYTLKFSKPGYLSRSIVTDSIIGDYELNEENHVVELWAGDVPKNGVSDGAINIGDIIKLSTSFNSTFGDSRYVEYCDFDLDKAINMNDVIIIAKHFNAITNVYPKFYIIPRPTPFPVGKVEAENMALNGYTVDKTSSVNCIKLKDTVSIGTCSYVFNGDIGFYDVNIRYLDEDNGQSKMGLYIHNESSNDYMWKLDSDDNTWKIKTIKNVLIQKGDTITVQGNRNKLEGNKIDYIETVLTSVPTATPTSTKLTIYGVVTVNDIEGHWYVLDTGGATYCLNNFLPVDEMKNLVHNYIQVTGYADLYSIHICPGIPFEVLSYHIIDLSTLTPNPTPTSTATLTPTPTPTPTSIQTPAPTATSVPVKSIIYGTVTESNLDGNWYIIRCYGITYELSNFLPPEDMKKLVGKNIEVTGYAHPDGIHLGPGIPFEVLSYRIITPTPTPLYPPVPMVSAQ